MSALTENKIYNSLLLLAADAKSRGMFDLVVAYNISAIRVGEEVIADQIAGLSPESQQALRHR